MKLSIYTDGGARGNPGPAAIGIVIKNEKGEVTKEVAKYIGETTNNEAEYRALIDGLDSVLDKEAKDVECFSDSKLVVSQLNGDFKVKNVNIKRFVKEIKRMERNFDTITYTHIGRSKNSEADALVNEVLDSM